MAKTVTIEKRSKQRVVMGSTVVFNELDLSGEKKEKYFTQLVNVSTNGILIVDDRFLSVRTLLTLSLYIKRWQKYSKDFFKFDQTSISKPLVAVGKVSRIYQINNEIT